MDDFFDKNPAVQTGATDPKTENLALPMEKGKHQRQHRDKPGEPSPPRIGVHCVAGLGRAPLLVALALVHKGCSRINAIELIRKNRPGSLNMI